MSQQLRVPPPVSVWDPLRGPAKSPSSKLALPQSIPPSWTDRQRLKAVHPRTPKAHVLPLHGKPWHLHNGNPRHASPINLAPCYFPDAIDQIASTSPQTLRSPLAGSSQAKDRHPTTPKPTFNTQNEPQQSSPAIAPTRLRPAARPLLHFYRPTYKTNIPSQHDLTPAYLLIPSCNTPTPSPPSSASSDGSLTASNPPTPKILLQRPSHSPHCARAGRPRWHRCLRRMSRWWSWSLVLRTGP